MRRSGSDGQPRQLRMGVIFRRPRMDAWTARLGQRDSRPDVTAIPRPTPHGPDGLARAGRRPASSFTLRRVQSFSWEPAMRRALFSVATLAAVLLAACTGAATSAPTAAPTAPPTSAPARPRRRPPRPRPPPATPSPSAAACAGDPDRSASGKLTVGADNPAYPPYFQPDPSTPADAKWQLGDPLNGQGFEAAVAYAVAKAMGFSQDQVAWDAGRVQQRDRPGRQDLRHLPDPGLVQRRPDQGGRPDRRLLRPEPGRRRPQGQPDLAGHDGGRPGRPSSSVPRSARRATPTSPTTSSRRRRRASTTTSTAR